MSAPSTPQRKATAELLLISPIALSGLALSSSRKRRNTPTAEVRSPKKIAVITSPGAVSPLLNSIHRSSFPNPLGWFYPAELAHIDQRLPLYECTLRNPLFQGAPTQDAQMPPPARHLILPFDLRDDPSAMWDPERRDMMLSIFPGTTGIASDRMFVYLQLRMLPPKPWPLTMAGLPLYFSLEMGPGPLPPTRLVPQKNGSIAEDRNGLDMEDWKPLFHIIKDYFEGLRVSITEVMYWGNFVYIVLKHRDTDFNKLPWHVAKIRCFYLFDDEIGRPPAPRARRLLDPTPGNLDDSQYDTLQPGLRVTSSHPSDSPGMFLSTTTSVLLKDEVSNEFMTAASHGFPAGCGTQVFHALPSNGRKIGELIREVPHTDVALVKLRDTESFSNVTFQNDDTPQPIQLKKLVWTQERRTGDTVYIDSPDTGCIEGTFMKTSFQAVPSDDGSPEQHWVFTAWCYGGQDSAINLPEGMCGSAIWSKDGDVWGFFKYAPKEGVMKDWCAGIAADELISRGLPLSIQAIEHEDVSRH